MRREEGEGGAPVLPFGGEPNPSRAAPVQVRLEEEPLIVGLTGALEVVACVPALVLLLASRMRQLLGVILADRRQHAVALALAAKEALVDERLQRVDVRLADFFCRRQGASADKDGEAHEQAVLALVQQVVAPGDRRLERALTLGGVARAAGQQRQPPLQALEQLVRRE